MPDLTDYELITEVCHDLINSAIRMEEDELSHEPFPRQLRAKERAIRNLLASVDELRSCWREEIDLKAASWKECAELSEKCADLTEEVERLRQSLELILSIADKKRSNHP